MPKCGRGGKISPIPSPLKNRKKPKFIFRKCRQKRGPGVFVPLALFLAVLFSKINFRKCPSNSFALLPLSLKIQILKASENSFWYFVLIFVGFSQFGPPTKPGLRFLFHLGPPCGPGNRLSKIVKFYCGMLI